MPARSIGSATLSFGLVSIPVKFYVATHSEQVSFNQLHAPCGSRIRQQLFCPRCARTVERTELVKGYEVGADRYVTFTEQELKALEAAAATTIDIAEFVPLDQVDPVYFASTHYLGPDKGGEKAYQLLAATMADTAMVAVAQHVWRGKEHLVLIRPLDGRLVIHQLHYADEVRPLAEVETGPALATKPAELSLARTLVEQLAADTFEPGRYEDHYRQRVRTIIDQKVAGEEIAVSAGPAEKPQVIDLMEALRRSLGAGRPTGKRTTARAATKAAPKRRVARKS